MPTTTSADGIDVEYERRGEGQPLVLLHGGMAPRQYWEPVIPHFEEFAAVVPQRPGFGTCLDDHEETGPDEVLGREVASVRALVDDLGADDESDAPPVLLGHSFGALTAIETARALSADDQAAEIEAVVAYEPAVLPESFREHADLADRMAALLDDGDREGAMKLYVDQVIHAGEGDDLDAWLDEWPVWPDCVELAEEVIRMNYAVERYEVPERLDVAVPTLVLSGTDGPDFLRESARTVHDALPSSRFVEFDGVSHSGPSEAPARTADELHAFLGVR
ncbi:hydrolase [Halosimplex carlsbadense 2-9-1]|uniref:Hydrolase n=1 Tax=Halosimplex carlsbadense 2-9-1 TaxID=797114 RepID=M0CYM1_9EURY|nr:alpha/beta hydrolase [Halosimplex carlsbadense]ELZ27502.1 hydrolase [Halosimplex carlsbadense 2-9-1]